MAYKGSRLSSGREVMPVSVYEALSAMLQFGLWILALKDAVYLCSKKPSALKSGYCVGVGCRRLLIYS
ncbi:putative holin-like toxin [Paenibacillus alvei]|uniref:putative holin-like toxin n=1 Tax=Paenibacillus alvei TaxID=44250 RepID=UPI00399029E9